MAPNPRHRSPRHRAGRHRGAGDDSPRQRTQRNLIAVTGACLLTRRETCGILGRFDESHTRYQQRLGLLPTSLEQRLRQRFHPRHAHRLFITRLPVAESSRRSKTRAALKVNGGRFSRAAIRISTSTSDATTTTSLRSESRFVGCARGLPLFDREAIRRVLVVKLDHIGDCIASLHAVRLLKQNFPAPKVTVRCGKATAAVWSNEQCVDDTQRRNSPFLARSCGSPCMAPSIIVIGVERTAALARATPK
jgi:hypothetical protein